MFASRQPSKEVKRAERNSTRYSILGSSRRWGQNPFAEWAPGTNVTRDVPRLCPGEDDQGLTPPILRQRRLGSGISLEKPIPRGEWLGERSGRIGRFKGAGSLVGQAGRVNPSAHPASGEE
jgi:hypothetical protein